MGFIRWSMLTEDVRDATRALHGNRWYHSGVGLDGLFTPQSLSQFSGMPVELFWKVASITTHEVGYGKIAVPVDLSI